MTDHLCGITIKGKWQLDVSYSVRSLNVIVTEDSKQLVYLSFDLKRESRPVDVRSYRQAKCTTISCVTC